MIYRTLLFFFFWQNSAPTLLFFPDYPTYNLVCRASCRYSAPVSVACNRTALSTVRLDISILCVAYADRYSVDALPMPEVAIPQILNRNMSARTKNACGEYCFILSQISSTVRSASFSLDLAFYHFLVGNLTVVGKRN